MRQTLGKLEQLTLLLFMGGFTLPALSSEWVITPGVTVEQVYTDNANLDTEERSESITRISPRISAYREGARARLDLRYAPQYRHYWQETQDNEVIHFLRADGNVELIEQHLFLDGWATADQQTIDSSGRTGVDSLTGGDDLTQVYTAGLSPYLTGRLGKFVNLEARYGFDRVVYTDDELDSSTGQRVDLVFGNSRLIKALPWELHLEQNQIDYDDLEDDDRISRARGEAAYQFNRRWALAAALGYEKYELAVNEDSDGEIWSLGFIFTPSPRTRLAAGYGERAFGEDYYLDFSHRSRRMVWTAGYRRDFVSARDEVLQPSLFDREDDFGNLIRDPVLTNPVTISRSGPTLDEGHYLLDALTARVALAATRTSLVFTAAHRKRQYEEPEQPEDSTDTDFSAQLNRTLRTRLRGFLRLRWRDHEEETTDYQQWTGSIGGSYQLGADFTLGLDLSHLERDASLDEDSYTENRVSLRLDKQW